MEEKKKKSKKGRGKAIYDLANSTESGKPGKIHFSY
jgi:hypothetical protein